MQVLITRSDELYHYGVLGMKWGVRRYRNKDGSLISSGKEKRLKQDSIRLKKAYEEAQNDAHDYFWKANNYYKIPQYVVGAAADKAWKETYNAHEKAVKSSRKMRNIEREFISKYSDVTMSGFITKNKSIIEKGKQEIAVMPIDRLTYKEGARGGFFNFVPGDGGNIPTFHNTIKYTKSVRI